jgi:hypothetical protein
MIHIIGGGLQGCFFAIALQELAGISHDAIRIYDPAPRLLDTWLRQTAACGMSHLRSSSSHSIHPDFNHLRNFARSRGIDLWKPGPFSMPYHRPSLELFNDHAAHCIGEYRLESLHVRARVDRLLPGGGIGIAAEELPGIALYAGGFQHGGLNIPPWTEDLRRRGIPADHVFSPETPAAAELRPIIVGSGISGFQYALREIREGRKPILVTRREPEIYRFDFDPCFIGPRCRPRLDEALRNGGAEARMELILQHRYSGTIPEEIYREFRHSERIGNAELLIEPDQDRLVAAIAELAESTPSRVVFCTGFARPSAADWKPAGLERLGMIRGYPLPGEGLKLGNYNYVTGAAAMYRLGPAAMNLIGAHLAWRIIGPQLASVSA